MTITCPACGKANPLEASTACARCGCDLTRLVQVFRAAAWHLRAAADAVRGQDWTQAQHHAELSWNLRHSPQAAQIASLAAVALGDTVSVLQWRSYATMADAG